MTYKLTIILFNIAHGFNRGFLIKASHTTVSTVLITLCDCNAIPYPKSLMILYLHLLHHTGEVIVYIKIAIAVFDWRVACCLPYWLVIVIHRHRAIPHTHQQVIILCRA